jgi:hypothetical protein
MPHLFIIILDMPKIDNGLGLLGLTLLQEHSSSFESVAESRM